MSSKTLVMLGAGGHAKVCYDIAKEMKQWDEIIILDDNHENYYFSISGKIDEINKYPSADFFIAIGDNNIREKLLLQLQEKNYSIATLIHPHAVIASDVTIDRGTAIMAGVIVNSNSQIGRGCILNTKCSVDHDNTIGNFVHISPGVTLAGTVKIFENTWVGSGAIIINNVTVAQDSIIGAGSLVLKDILESGTYIGAPVRRV